MEQIFVSDMDISPEMLQEMNAPLSDSHEIFFKTRTLDTGKEYLLTVLKAGTPESIKIWSFMAALTKLQFSTLHPYVGFSAPETSNIVFPTLISENSGFRTLQEVISGVGPRLNNSQKRIVALGFISALRYLHSFKVIHSNISLNSLLVTDTDEGQLAGYGLPYLLTSKIVGRPEVFLPPENIPTEQGDIYDFGLIMKALATDAEPEDSSVPEGLEPALAEFLVRALDPIRTRRPTIEDCLKLLVTPTPIFGQDDCPSLDSLTKYSVKQINISVSVPPSKIRFIQLCRFAETGDSVAQNKVGLLFEKGIDTDRDDAQALRFFRLSADQGNLDAICNLGRIYFEGKNRFADRSIEIAISYYERAGQIGEARRGEYQKQGAEALFHAAEILNVGMLPDDISDPALAYYERAASLGHTESALKIGRFLFKHVNNPVQRQRTGEFLRRAAENGSAPGQNEYGRFLEKVLHDDKGALKFYMLAADQGHEFALYNAGRVLLKRGTKEAIDEGIVYMRASAEKLNSLAMLKLGTLYLKGKYVERDPAEGFRLIKGAVEQRNYMALNTLGECYMFGEGTEQSIPDARRCFEQAAMCRVPRGCTNFGQMLLQDGPEHMKDAFAVFRLAAEMNDAIGMVSCGQLLESGFGGQEDPNYAQAMAYYQRAAALGNSFAYCNLGRMYQNGRGIAQDSGRAVKMFRQAVDMGNTNAMFNLGQMYENGAGVPTSLPDAMRFYQMAAERGNPFALDRCADILEATGNTEDRIKASKMRRFAETKRRVFGLIPDGLTIQQALGPFEEK